MNPKQEEFLKLHLFDDKKYKEIAEMLDVSVEILRTWWEELAEERAIINRAKQYFNSRKGKDEFKSIEDQGRYKFFQWYKKQKKVCYYCRSEEYKLSELFGDEKNGLSTKRGRGRK